MIDHNHPTKPGDRTVFEVESSHHIHGTSCLCGFQSRTARERTEHITRRALTAFAHDPKSADDLRHTPVGRALMAEAWDALSESMCASGEFHDVDLRTMERLNPYKETPDDRT